MITKADVPCWAAMNWNGRLVRAVSMQLGFVILDTGASCYPTRLYPVDDEDAVFALLHNGFHDQKEFKMDGVVYVASPVDDSEGAICSGCAFITRRTLCSEVPRCDGRVWVRKAKD